MMDPLKPSKGLTDIKPFMNEFANSTSGWFDVNRQKPKQSIWVDDRMKKAAE